MPEEPRNDFTYMLMLLLERATTLSLRVEVLQRALDARGLVTAAEVDQQTADLRARWELPQHPHGSLSQELTTEDFVGRLRRFLVEGPSGSPPDVPPA
jgi:sulfur relay (sulfurtransferase) complex TusBCD TusD component (DsrE family)